MVAQTLHVVLFACLVTVGVTASPVKRSKATVSGGPPRGSVKEPELFLHGNESTKAVDYSHIVITAEKQVFAANNYTPAQKEYSSQIVNVYNSLWQIYEKASEGIYGVGCRRAPYEKSSCYAEILFLAANGTVIDKIRKEFGIPNDEFTSPMWDPSAPARVSVIIRILEKKEKYVNAFTDRSASDATFLVKNEAVKADRQWLAAASPFFHKRFQETFAETQQDGIILEGIESAEIFKDFLLAVSPLRVKPNPSNVVALLELANRYDVPFLVRSCEEHLLMCSEIPLADRASLALAYDLPGLKIAAVPPLTKNQLENVVLKFH